MKKISAHQTSDRRRTLALSIIISALVATLSLIGLLYPDIYAFATPNWRAQTVGQDAYDLFLIAPLVLFAGLYAYAGNRLAWMIWGGTIAYLVYTFLIYCFCVTFNPLFGMYCAVLGLSLFSLIWFIQSSKPSGLNVKSDRFKTTAGYYFMGISILFYMLWLREIIPASVAGEVPASVASAGLPTNPVHVIDLSMFLPSVFLLGLGLLNRAGRGYAINKFRGRQMLFGEIEYRFDISASGLLGATIFANGQSLAGDEGTLKEVAPAIGMGLRLKFNRYSDTNIALDLALGREGINFNVNLGEYF